MADPAIALALYLALSGPGGWQTDTLPQGIKMQVHAARASGEITLDGQLAEAMWADAPPISGFIQREPDEGAPATESTEVRVLYDDDAVYIGARLHDSRPDSIRAQLARRDRITNSDRFLVFLDCYHDRRTGFYFAVTREGGVGAGDTIELMARAEDDLTVADIVDLYTVDAKNQELLRRATRSEFLPESWKGYFRKRLRGPDA